MALHRNTKQRERGFALLFIFALAGIAAVMLYNELPRAVFESQRAKEDLLVTRGQEYQRGIQLYYRKLRKYPVTMEDLEKTNGIRFLRRRYVDPFSGKDDWRLVHVGPTGQFTDSKVIKPPAAQGTGLGANATGTTGTNGQPKEDPNDPASRKRASDVSAAEIGGPATSLDPNALPTGAPPAPVYPGRTAIENNYNAPQGNAPLYPSNASRGMGGMGGMGGVGSAGGGGGMGGVGSVGIGLPNSSYPSASVNSQAGGAMNVPLTPNNGNLQNQNGQRPLSPEQLNPALDLIGRLLTQPRQPPPGVNTGNQPSGPITNPSGTFNVSGPAANGGNGQFGGGGIAGVASKHEGRGIKLVNERERIEEWEFIYDFGKDRGGRPNTNSQSQQANPGGFGQQGNQNPAQGTSSFGNSNSSGFGQQGGSGQGQQGGQGQQRQQNGSGRMRN